MICCPITLAEANEIVGREHRHRKEPTPGCRFAIGLRDADGVLIGAAIVGRPVARKTEQYKIAEVVRLVTTGTKNACSRLYGACARACAAIGYDEIQTFTLQSEPGTSLRASGWELVGTSPGKSNDWQTRTNRKGGDTQPRFKWRKQLRSPK